MEKRLFCFALTLCMCFSFPLVSAAQGEPATGGNLQDDLSALGSLVETNSPAGAVGIAYDISSGTTRYYGISGNILADANISEPLTVPGWFPETETSVIGGGDSPDYIIGNDSSVQVTDTTVMPYSAIMYLLAGGASGLITAGTAFMISPNVALTAAHCVYLTSKDENTGEILSREWATSVAAIPGLNGEGNAPFELGIASEIVIPVQYYETQNVNYDWALIRFTRNIGNSTGYFGYQFVPHSMEGMYVTVSGYPSETASKEMYQWKDSGNLGFFSTSSSTNYDYVIDYYMDTEQGQSGAPLYRYSDGTWTVVAIHSHGGTNSNGTRYNQGVRFTSQMFSFVLAYRNL